MESLTKTLRPGELMATTKKRAGRPKGAKKARKTSKKSSRRFKKGTPEARAHMAKVRAAGGKGKKRRAGRPKAATSAPTPAKKTRKRRAGRPAGAKRGPGRSSKGSSKPKNQDSSVLAFLGIR